MVIKGLEPIFGSALSAWLLGKGLDPDGKGDSALRAGSLLLTVLGALVFLKAPVDQFSWTGVALAFISAVAFPFRNVLLKLEPDEAEKKRRKSNKEEAEVQLTQAERLAILSALAAGMTLPVVLVQRSVLEMEGIEAMNANHVTISRFDSIFKPIASFNSLFIVASAMAFITA